MFPRIRVLKPLEDYRLYVEFDDGRAVVYDVKRDFVNPGYDLLVQVPRLFEHVQLDESRTCVYWNDMIDLPSDCIYEIGEAVR